MREVEGGNRNWLMRILRHEAGHAIDSAYQMRRMKSWREVFGPSSLPYPDTYRPRPAAALRFSHLGAWYAQAHPTEDFAETFAGVAQAALRVAARNILAGQLMESGVHRRLDERLGTSKPGWRSAARSRKSRTKKTGRAGNTTNTSWRAIACHVVRVPITAAQNIHHRAAQSWCARAATVLRELRNALRQRMVRSVASASIWCIRCCV